MLLIYQEITMKDLEIIKFKNNETEIDVYISKTINEAYLSQKEMASLFNVSIDSISFYLKKFSEEYRDWATSEEFSIVRVEGSRKVNRKIKFYRLEIVSEIGRRLKSNIVKELKDFINNYLKETSVKLEENSEIIIYDNGEVHIPLNVSLDEQTIWSSESQMADIFETTRQNINYHINNVLSDEELDRNSVRKEYLHTGPDGKKYLVFLYNLDMLLAVGFRIKTSKAISFRRWSYEVLTKTIKQGFYFNYPRCIECHDAIERIETELSNIRKDSEHTFEPEKELVSYSAVERFLRTAKKQIIIVDNYFGHDFDTTLSEINVEIIIITNPKNIKIESNLNYKVVKTNIFHDRYLLVDNICYSFGQSFDELGTKVSKANRCYDQKNIDLIKKIAKETN